MLAYTIRNGGTEDAYVLASALFEQARKIHTIASESSVDQDLLMKGCELLRQCEEMVSKLGLFSLNETKDDISTVNLKYILSSSIVNNREAALSAKHIMKDVSVHCEVMVQITFVRIGKGGLLLFFDKPGKTAYTKPIKVPYYLAELTEKFAEDGRIKVLKASQAKLKLVPEEEMETSKQGGANTFADHRAKKVGAERASERSTKASALSTPVETGEDDVLDDDGEEEREAWLTTISLASSKGLDLLEMLNKEKKCYLLLRKSSFRYYDGEQEFSQLVLDERTKSAETGHRDAAARAYYTKPAAPITCATTSRCHVEGPVSQAHEHKHQPLIFGPASLVGRNITTNEKIAAQGKSVDDWKEKENLETLATRNLLLVRRQNDEQALVRAYLRLKQSVLL
ncbi:hypothetical protein HAX54_019848 [Datura stramonium]|uniref:Uncharacterized protein n=1 Tax=Datura stramonium TaxID=4076 RepID=A0ABS8USV2_DATST|nr:hypothetical protein [Datura stramonium]